MKRLIGPLITVLMALALATASCSVSTNEEPVAAGDVFGEFEQPTTTTSSTVPEGSDKTALVYFLEADGSTTVQAVRRTYEQEAGIEEVLADLFETPPAEEETGQEGDPALTTAIPETATLRSAEPARRDARELVVDATGLFGSIDGSQLRNALAQIVYTATARPGVSSVSFTSDGETRSPIVGDGTTVERPVEREDYQELR
jgi:spore germination protein GerM